MRSVITSTKQSQCFCQAEGSLTRDDELYGPGGVDLDVPDAVRVVRVVPSNVRRRDLPVQTVSQDRRLVVRATYGKKNVQKIRTTCCTVSSSQGQRKPVGSGLCI